MFLLHVKRFNPNSIIIIQRIIIVSFSNFRNELDYVFTFIAYVYRVYMCVCLYKVRVQYIMYNVCLLFAKVC